MKQRIVLIAATAALLGGAGAAVALGAGLVAPLKAATVAAAPEPAARPPQLPAADLERVRGALSAARAGDWAAVRAAIATAGDPLARRLIEWRLYGDRASPATFEETAAAIAALQGWPAQDTMRRKAEQLIFDSALTPAQRISWLTAGGAPLSGDGEAALAGALAAAGRRDEAVALARKTWRERALTERAEGALLAEFSPALTASDHAARADGLLWRDNPREAAGLLGRLRPEDRAVVEARIALQQRRTRGLQALVDRATAVRADDPGLLYDRARYIRRTGRPETALPLAARIDPAKASPAAREPLAEERRLYVSRALRQGDHRTAYRLAANHGLRSGVAFADAEFLSGWISLRFLNDPAQAKAHFETLNAGVSASVSRSRALYWLGEAHRALGDVAAANAAYDEAAKLDFTFYGQLAAEKRDPRHVISLGPPLEIGAAERAAFENREVVRALRAVALVGDERDFESIAFFLDDQLATAAEHELLAEIARERGLLRTAVRSAKAGLGRGLVAREGAYPVVPLPADAQGAARPEPALILALTRQESEFNPQAVSPAGARGLMQLMPATAQITARRYGLPYDRARLTTDPAYNVSLGAAHLQDLLDEWDGSYVLAIAAYNAGSGRPRQWIEEFGDPRHPGVDVVDWIEMIPFAETRNYVMRVMENVQVYRHRLNGAPTQLALERDLRRGGRS